MRTATESCEKSASNSVDSKLAVHFKGTMQATSEPKFMGSSSGVSKNMSLNMVTHEEDDEHVDSSSHDSDCDVGDNDEATPTKTGDTKFTADHSIAGASEKHRAVSKTQLKDIKKFLKSINMRVHWDTMKQFIVERPRFFQNNSSQSVAILAQILKKEQLAQVIGN